MIDIFRKKDPTAVDRHFAESFIQHDPSITDGLAGMKTFAADVASSPTADITIYRTLVDGDFVLLHSRYDGVDVTAHPAIAFDLFRFKDGKIVEHWGGQEPEAPPNLSGRTQVDGPTEVLDRDKTEANRTLVRTYRETVMVSLRFDRIEEFIEGAHYAQHASKIGDGIARLRDRIASVARKAGSYFSPRAFRVRGQLCTCPDGGRAPSRANCALRSVSGRERKNSRARRKLLQETAAVSRQVPLRPFLDPPFGAYGREGGNVRTVQFLEGRKKAARVAALAPFAAPAREARRRQERVHDGPRDGNLGALCKLARHCRGAR